MQHELSNEPCSIADRPIAPGMGNALSSDVVTRCLFGGSASVFSEDSPSDETPCFTSLVTRPEAAKGVRYLSRHLTIEYERAGNRQLVPQLWNKDGVCLCGSCDEHQRTGLPGTRCDLLFETDVKEVQLQLAIQGPQYLSAVPTKDSGDLQMNSARKSSRHGAEPGSCRILQVAECGTLASAEYSLAAFARKLRVHLRRTLPLAFIKADSNSDTGSVASRSRSFLTLCGVDSTECSLPDVDVCESAMVLRPYSAAFSHSVALGPTFLLCNAFAWLLWQSSATRVPLGRLCRPF